MSPRQIWSPPVVGGRWAWLHGPAGRSLLLRQSSRLVDHRPVGADGWAQQSRDHASLWIMGLAGLRDMVLVDIMRACAAWALQA
jgi:hypothetical protein